MAVHLLRDYFTQNITTANRRWIPTYIINIFLRRVLGYSHVGSTNFPINAVGTLLIATGDINPTGAASFPVGNKAGINLGTQKEFFVNIPISVRTVAGTDIGRILVLRSTAYPRFNSGLFVIVGIDLPTNSYVIDYRTLGDYPPIEATDSIQWWLYEKDLNCPTQGGPNTKVAGSYRGDGDSPTPRIILQSPHATGWQVRICNESTLDVSENGELSTAANCPMASAAPGFGGTIAGDFSLFGQHFHAPMWYNSSNRMYLGGAPGFGDIFNAIGTQLRITIVGDDTGQGVVMYCRRQFNANDPLSTIVCFGLAENEPSPLPVNNLARLFVLGSGHMGWFGLAAARYTNDGGLNAARLQQFGTPTDNYGPAQGMSATPFGTPVMCAASMWAFISSGGQATGPHLNFFASDTPYTSSTELLPIDIMQGTLHTWAHYTLVNDPVYPYAPRTIGTIPHIKLGRSNFGDFSPTTDFERSYQHLRRGLYIPWVGPNIIP